MFIFVNKVVRPLINANKDLYDEKCALLSDVTLGPLGVVQG